MKSYAEMKEAVANFLKGSDTNWLPGEIADMLRTDWPPNFITHILFDLAQSVPLAYWPDGAWARVGTVDRTRPPKEELQAHLRALQLDHAQVFQIAARGCVLTRTQLGATLNPDFWLDRQEQYWQGVRSKLLDALTGCEAILGSANLTTTAAKIYAAAQNGEDVEYELIKAFEIHPPAN